MVPWDDAITIMSKGAKVSSTDTDAVTYLKMMANIGYKLVLAALGRAVIEKTITASTVASQQAYQLPGNSTFIKSITVTVGGIAHPVYEEESQDDWNILNETTQQTSDIPSRFFVRPRFGPGGTEILLWPIPASSGNTITVVTEVSERDMTAAAYSTGTISLTSGSATVTGSGTVFIAAMIGRYLKVTSDTGDGLWYRVASRSSNTSIALENVYEGTTVSGLSYQISEMFGLPEDLQILPCYFALWHWYSNKTDAQKLKDYFSLFDNGIKEGKKRYGTRTRGMSVGSAPISPSTYPTYFPTSITS